MAKKSQDKETKTIRSSYYLHQVTPIITYTIILASVFVGKTLLEEKYPIISSDTLQQNTSTITSMQSTMESLNTSKKSNIEKKNMLEDTITEIRTKRESEGSLRFYTINIPAFCRYVEFRASDYSIDIVNVDIIEEENKVDYVIMGDYPDLVNFFNSLETREIYYIENFELMPSLTNSGSYVKFTANFNLDATITQRYEKKVKYEKPTPPEQPVQEDSNVNEVPEEVTDVQVNLEAPQDTMNTGKPAQESPQNPTTDSNTGEVTTEGDTVVVEPIN